MKYNQDVRFVGYCWHYNVSMCVRCPLPALLIGILLFAVRLERRIYPLPQELHLAGVGQTLGIFR